MTEQILGVLAIAPGPQTTAEVCDSLRRLGLKPEEFQVVEQLRQLQRAGIVQLERVRWRLLKMPSNTNTAMAARPAEPDISAKINSSHLSSVQTGVALPSVFVPQPVGRWALFRRLCRYYMDCLLQDEAPQLRAYVDNEDDTWLAVPDVPWARLAAGGNFAVSLAREQAPFQRNRARRGSDDCVYLGYPLVLVKPQESSGFVVPLFAQPMKADWSAGILHLEPDGPIAVNGAWLEYRFRQRAEREAFLRGMGFLSDVSEDSDDDERTEPGPKDFSRLAQDAAHYLHEPERFAERIEPFALSRVSNWRSAERGLYNQAILTLGPRLRYTRSLLRDLRDISEKLTDTDLDGTALTQVFPHETPPPLDIKDAPPVGQTGADDSTTSRPRPESQTLPPLLPSDQLVQTRLLHPCQRAAVVNALTEAVSVVTGPPGTGKSEVVAIMMLNQLVRGHPTLFASKNHQALEAVLPRLNSAVEGGELIIQASSRDLAQRQNYLGKLQSLLARPPRPDAAQVEAFLQRFHEIFGRQREAILGIQALEQAREEYGKLNAQLEEVRIQLPLPAQTDDALAHWSRELTPERLEALETNLCAALRLPSNIIQRLWHLVRRRKIEARRRLAREPLLAVPNPFSDRVLPNTEAPFEAWKDFFTTWKAWAKASRLAMLVHGCEQRLAQLLPNEECNRRLAESQQAIEETTRKWMGWAAGGLPNLLLPTEREALANLRAGLQNWGPDRFLRELREHFPLILRAFPLWSVSNLSARNALPLVPGLFELLVIDEASQCDIASVVPLLARSKRVVFVGDPMQLRHISKLDVAVEQTLLQQYELTTAPVQRFTYRVNSAFDLGDANPSVSDAARVRLDLHFRSHDLIADYCNEAFYSKTLHVVTLTERLNIPRGVQPGIHWTHVTGQLVEGTTGAWCADEIEAIRRELLKLAGAGYRGTVGVVTPFRQQMLRLKDMLETGDALPAEFRERTQLLIDTAYGFQGGERDLIFFSLCGGPNLPTGGLLFFGKEPNQFNVAVSRARAVLHVVGDHEWAMNCGFSYIEKLARRTLSNERTAKSRQPEPYQSPWEKVLADALRQAGIDATPQYPIAGRFLDLAVLSPKKIDVEVDGESVHRTAGGGRKDDDYWRDLQLQSLGWQVCRFWVYELRENLPCCVEKVMKVLKG